MTKIECRYQAKLEIINSLLDYLDNLDDEQVDISELKSRLVRSQLYYRNQLTELF